MAEHRSRNDRIAFGEGHVPKFFPGFWVESKHAAAPDGDDLIIYEQGRAEGEFLFRVGDAIEFPKHLSGVLVERSHKRVLRPVAVEDQRAASHNWRAGVAVHRRILDGRGAPKDFAGKIEARSAVVAEVNVKPITFDHRGRTSVAVLGVGALWAWREEFGVPDWLPLARIETKGTQGDGVVGLDCGREEYVFAREHRRGPAEPRNGLLPHDIARRRPMNGKVRGG